MMLRSFPTSPWEGLDVPSAMLLGIQRDPGPPVVFGPHRFERLRIVIIDRDPGADEEGADLDGDEADDTEILPQIPLQRRGPLPAARPVHGEILRGEDGALYERFGQRIRPLRALASGPRGEVLEVAAAPVARTEDRGPKPESAKPKAEPAAPPPASDLPPPAPETAPAPTRALFADPGHWRVVRLGDFRHVLTPQLAHAERLRDAHWLPCHVQVFETPPPPSREAFAAHALGDATQADEILPLTPPLVHALQLAPVLPAPTRGTVRLLHLRLAHDPTEAELGEPKPETKEVKSEEKAPPPAPVPAPTAPALKTEIPAAFAQTAPYVLAREAAYADLVADDAARMSRMHRWFGRDDAIAPAALREWQLQLSGRAHDDQLWAVPPPAGWRRDASILTWAAHTLERAGYAAAMLPDWRLYWRRRGC